MNKSPLIVLLIIILSFINTSAFSNNFEKTDRIVKNYPRSLTNPNQLVKLINRDFELPEDKARAIYTWIAANIVYDIKALKARPKIIHYLYCSDEEKIYRERKIMEDLAIQTLRDKKATCQGYSALYKHICDLVSLECVIISGYSKTKKSEIGNMPLKINHAWNAVKIYGMWKLIDVSWGAGYLTEDQTKFIRSFKDIFFSTTPAIFNLNHYPEDPVWLFSDISKESFTNLPLYYPDFHNNDIEVVKPEKGIIRVSKEEVIGFTLKYANNKPVMIKFDNEKFAREVYPEITDQYCNYEIARKIQIHT